MDPLISIVVPIYNQEAYIAACLDSLFSQAGEAVELILIDDGSTDGSAAICETYIRQHAARARLIRQTNHGLLKTRQIGVSEASGEYILCVDSDDCLFEGAVEALLDTIRRRSPDIILFNASNDPEKRTPLFTYPFGDGAVFTGEEKYTLYRLLCGTDKLNNIWAKCIRRTLYTDEVFRDSDGISNGEDLYQSLVLTDRAETVVYLDRVLYYYRVTRGSMSRTYQARHFQSEKKVCTRRLAYAEKWSHGGELVRAADVWICRILRDITRKLFVSDLPRARAAQELRSLRADAFYQAHYLRSKADSNVRDIVLKSPQPVFDLFRLIYRLKPRG